MHNIFKYLVTNENLVKLLYNENDDPLNTDLPVGENPYKLVMYKNLFPYMKVVDVDEEGANAYVNIYFGMGKNKFNSKYYKVNYMFVDVYVHNDLWDIDTGIRTYQIMHEIDKMLNSKTIPNTTIDFNFDEYKAIPNVNTKYAGYGMIYYKIDMGVEGACVNDY